MKTKILSKEMVGDTIFTEVEFDDEKGNVFIEKVLHFRPQSIEEIEESISNRAISEIAKQEAIIKAKAVFEKIPSEK